VIVVFIVVFNIGCFFVDYDIVRAVWDVVNERSLSWTYRALCMRVALPRRDVRPTDTNKAPCAKSVRMPLRKPTWIGWSEQ